MGQAHIIGRPPVQWECPNCPAVARTPWSTANRFHTCAGLRGLSAPMLRAGTRARVHAVVREDYVGLEDVPLDAEGRPVMAVVTVRDDGQDVAVYAPTAHARIGG